MAIKKVVEIVEGAVDIGRQLVPLSKGQNAALDRAIVLTGPARKAVKKWSGGKALVTQGPSNIGTFQHIAGAPVSVGTNIKSAKPKFRSSKGAVTIIHRELIGFLDQFSNHVRYVGVVNPFNPYLFPWLSSIAGGYDMYRIDRLNVHYVPNCSTGTAGTIITAWDPAATDYTTDLLDLPSMHSVTVQPWMPSTLPIRASSKKYIGEQVSNTGVAGDIYNHGSLYVGTNGTGAAGLLFVDYAVTLFDPQPQTGLSNVTNVSGASTGVFTGQTYTDVDGFRGLNVSSGLLIPCGVWKVEVVMQGTGLANFASDIGTGLSNTTAVGVTSSTAILNTIFVKSSGSLACTIRFKCDFTTLTTNQVRITRVDPYSYASANVII